MQASTAVANDGSVARVRVPWIAVVVGLLLLLLARQADAREHAVLAFSRAADAETFCPTEGELRGAVVARLGYDPFDKAQEDAPILRVHFARNANGFSSRIGRATEPAAAREMKSARCADLLAPTAIALSIAIDPLASPSSSSSSSSSSSATSSSTTTLEPLPSPAPTAASTQPNAPPRDEPVKPPPIAAAPSTPSRFVLDLSPHVAFGSAPAPAAGVTLGAGGRFGAFSIVAEGRADLAASTQAAGGEVSAQLLAGALVPCLHRSIVAGCLVFTMGSVRGEGRGVTAPSRDSSLYAAIGGRFGLEIPIRDWLYFALRGDLVVAPQPTILRLNGLDAWTSPLFNAVLALGLGGMF